MKGKQSVLRILFILSVLTLSSCVSSTNKTITPVQVGVEPTETPIPGGEQGTPIPTAVDLQGSVDFIFIYAIYHPGDMNYSVTINIPFQIDLNTPPYTNIIGGSGSASASGVEEVEGCSVDITETYNIKNLGGSLITDDQGKLLLNFTWQTNNVGEFYLSCDDITLPLGGDEWSENEVTLPVIDGYEYVYSPDTPVRYKLHLNTLP